MGMLLIRRKHWLLLFCDSARGCQRWTQVPKGTQSSATIGIYITRSWSCGERSQLLSDVSYVRFPTFPLDK